MRPLEITIPIVLATQLLWPHDATVQPNVGRLLPAIALLLTVVQIGIEGYRWQMIPIYVLSSLLAIASLSKIYPPQDGPIAASIVPLVLLGLSTALPMLLPIPSISKPSGSYQVGTTSFELIDKSRGELYSGKDEPRRFIVRIWYPALVQPKDHSAPWMEHADIYGPAISRFLGLPGFFLDHLRLVKTPAYQDPEPIPGESAFPVIVFSHGWKGFNAQNTGQAIELASHGFVVVAVQHTYGAIVSVFPNGEVAYNNPNALPGDDLPVDEYEVKARKLVDQWAGDIACTLDSLSSQGAGDKLHPNYYDFSRIGVYGHSTGGGAAIQFCGTDPRCKALLGLDPFMRPVSKEVLSNGTTQPALFMFSQAWADDKDSRNNELFANYFALFSNEVRVVTVKGTAHHDFSDLPLLSPLSPLLGLTGTINGGRISSIAGDYVLAFFEKTLQGNSTSLLDGALPRYPEVQYLQRFSG